MAFFLVHLTNGAPDKYSLTIETFTVTPDLGGGGMHLYWDMTDPIGAALADQNLSAVPPVLSAWTQAPTAVSIELQETPHSDYTANGVIDTIAAR